MAEQQLEQGGGAQPRPVDGGLGEPRVEGLLAGGRELVDRLGGATGPLGRASGRQPEIDEAAQLGVHLGLGDRPESGDRAL